MCMLKFNLSFVKGEPGGLVVVFLFCFVFFGQWDQAQERQMRKWKGVESKMPFSPPECLHEQQFLIFVGDGVF